MQNFWWKKTVIYQIYIQSFKDTSGNGIGDIPGVIEKLDYLKNLGIGAIWLTPIYPSPLIDNGYDIADYQTVNPLYGDLEQLLKLINLAKEKRIGIILDMVLNHTSDQHPWFLEAKKSKDNPYRNYYIWRNHPDDTKSTFGGPAWTYDQTTEQWYLHQFAKEQPDLNWENPKLRQEIAQVLKWWCDQGVAGFRFDVIELIGKEIDAKIFANGPKLHQLIQEMRQNSWDSDEYLTVGECWGATIEDGIKYSNQNAKEFSMIFQFEHVTKLQDKLGKYKAKKYDFVKFKKIYQKWQHGLHQKGWNSLFLGNHDLPRMVSKYGNDQQYRKPSAKTLFTTMFLMEGTPYIFQGDEIGMTNIKHTLLRHYPDVEINQTYQEMVEQKKLLTHEEFLQGIYLNGRDNARTPFQWDDSTNAGFTTGNPWQNVNRNYLEINAKNDLQDPEGIYQYLQKLIQFRNQSEFSDLISDGDYVASLIEDPRLFVYSRTNDKQTIKILANWSDEEIDVSPLNVQKLPILLNTHQTFENSKLKPWQSVVLNEKRF